VFKTEGVNVEEKRVIPLLQITVFLEAVTWGKEEGGKREKDEQPSGHYSAMIDATPQ